MKNRLKEERTKVTLFGLDEGNNDVTLAYSNVIDQAIAHNANFTFANNGAIQQRTVKRRLLPTRIVSVWNSSNATVVSVWVLSEKDGIYRSVVEVDIDSEFVFLISKNNMNDGSERRIKLSIDL